MGISGRFSKSIVIYTKCLLLHEPTSLVLGSLVKYVRWRASLWKERQEAPTSVLVTDESQETRLLCSLTRNALSRTQSDYSVK